MKRNILKLLCSLGTLFMICCFSCKEHRIENKYWDNPFPAYKETDSLVSHKVLHIKLDSNTYLKNGVFQYDDQSGSIIGFSPFDNGFVFYDYASGILKKKIQFPKTGTNGIGTFQSFTYSFFYINSDSILLYKHSSAKLYLVDSGGKVNKIYSLKPSLGMNYTQPVIMVGQPLFTDRKEVVFTANPGRNILNYKAPLEDNLIARINLNNGKIRLGFRYPEIYREAFWGEYFHFMYSAYNPNNKSLVISLPIDHNVHVVDEQNKSKQFYAGSRHILHVNPIAFKGGKTNITAMELVDRVRTQRSYSRIIYDRYNNVYYRVVTNAIPRDDLKKTNTAGYKLPAFSIIILNDRFEKIGEQDLDSNKYSALSAFVVKDGLCIERNGDTEDELLFDIFKVVKR